MASPCQHNTAGDSRTLRELLRWPNVRRMLRTVCDLDDACSPSYNGAACDALLANAPAEAKTILHYLGQCIGTVQQQRISGFQKWMQDNQAWERGRRFLGVPDVCLPQPAPPCIDFNMELAAASPALYDMYIQDLLRLLSYGSLLTTDPSPYLDLFRWTDPAASTAWLPRQSPQRRQQQQQQPAQWKCQHEQGDACDHIDGDAAQYSDQAAVAAAAAAADCSPLEPTVAAPCTEAVAAVAPIAPPFGSSGAVAAAKLCREVPGLGLVPERMFMRAPAESERLRPLPHGDARVPIDWRSRLPPVLQWAHPAMPWYTPNRGSGLVLAGGAALSMVVPGAVASDVDLFLVVPSVDSATGLRRNEEQHRAAAWQLVREALEALQRQVAVHDRSLNVYALAGSHLHTLDLVVTDCPLDDDHSPDGDNLVAQLQLVLRLYESPAQVVHGFDVDVCTVLYDGADVWAAGRALRALHRGFLLVEPIRQSPSYEVRLHKYSKRLGLDILIPGLDPMLIEPAVREIEAIKSELQVQLAERLSTSWARTEQDQGFVRSSFHHSTRLPSVRKLAAKSGGLARLLLVQRLPELGVTVEEAKLLVNGYKHGNMTWADAVVGRAEAFRLAAMGLHGEKPRVICVKPGSSLFGDESTWKQLRDVTKFQVDDVHLQTGREALFSGSFTHTPFNDWYRCCLGKLEEWLMRGEVDWEARARERVVQEYNDVAQACAADTERALEAKCAAYLGLLAALRAGRTRNAHGNGAAAMAARVAAVVAAGAANAVQGSPAGGLDNVTKEVVSGPVARLFERFAAIMAASGDATSAPPRLLPNLGGLPGASEVDWAAATAAVDAEAEAGCATVRPALGYATSAPPPLLLGAEADELLATAAAGAPGLITRPYVSARTGELLYMGQRYRAVDTSAGAEAAMAEPSQAQAQTQAQAKPEVVAAGLHCHSSGMQRSAADATTAQSRLSTAPGSLLSAWSLPPGARRVSEISPDPSRAVQAAEAASEATTPQTSARPAGCTGHAGEGLLPFLDAETSGYSGTMNGRSADHSFVGGAAAARADPWVTAAVVTIAVALAGGHRIGSLAVAGIPAATRLASR